jgi:hypothetical protein
MHLDFVLIQSVRETSCQNATRAGSVISFSGVCANDCKRYKNTQLTILLVGLINLLQLCPALTSLTLVIDTTDGSA